MKTETLESVEIEVSEKVESAIKNLFNSSIVLYNDDVNSFEHVILCLMKYCNHNPIQAEQCAFIVHNRGKCSVKNGSYEELKPICEALLENKLSAKIQ